jgi:hypothetical protein
MYDVYTYVSNSRKKLEKMVSNARKQGKSEQEIDQLVSAGLDQMLRKIKREKMFG